MAEWTVRRGKFASYEVVSDTGDVIRVPAQSALKRDVQWSKKVADGLAAQLSGPTKVAAEA